MKVTGSPLLLSLSLCFSGLSLATAAVPGVEHVVVIGCDGFGSLAFTGDHTPTLSELMREGAYTLKVRGVMPTSSSPNWASMIMGAGPEQHGITSNDWETNKFTIAPIAIGSGGMFPTIFGVLREQKSKSRIACIYDWDGFGRLLERSAPDTLENVKGSPATAKRAVEVIKQDRPDFLFIHFDEVDHAGHKHGWKSPEYYAAVREVDGLIGEIIQALQQAGIYEKTILVMSADHGGTGTSHGGESMAELEIPLILRGPGIRRTEIKTSVNTYDLAPTLAWIFGLNPPGCWIGKPVLEAFE
jgi:predicted AlkP superfamily pyrophosphatase or phosphodiesterase